MVVADRKGPTGSGRLAADPTPNASEFEDFYREHADAVYRFCLSQLRDPAAAEDVAADVFVSAFNAMPRAELPDGAARPWLMRIARNAAIDAHRRERVHRSFLARQPRPGQGHDVEAAALLRNDLRQALDAVGRLRKRDRVLVGLRVAAELPYAEIARVTGMTENAAWMATQRALERVRKHLETRA